MSKVPPNCVSKFSNSGLVPFQEFPKMLQRKVTHISEEEKAMISDYRKLYVQGLRQLSIRQQNIKFKAGTLSHFAYRPPNPSSQNVNFMELLTGADETQRTKEAIIFSLGTFVLICQKVQELLQDHTTGDIYILEK